MPNPVPANGEAMPAKALSRRAALGALASVPALALQAAAVALTMPAGPTLSKLIEAHRVAYAAFHVEIEALEASEPDRETLIKCVGSHLEVGINRPDDMLELVDKEFDREAESFAALARFAPEIADAARARLEEMRLAAHARVEAVFAEYRAAEARYSGAADAERDALTAICAHRCTSFDELAEKARFLMRHCERDELTPEQYDAVLEALLPQGEMVEA